MSYIGKNKNVNAYFFDTWTPESCYVFGFLLADGCLCEYNYSYKVASGETHVKTAKKVIFANKEKSIIDQIKVVMGSMQTVCEKNQVDRRYGEVKVNTRYDLQISNKRLISRIETLGVEPRKSLKEMHIPESIPNSLFHHFFRGYFDGDGSIYEGGMYVLFNVENNLELQFIERLRSANQPLPLKYTYPNINGVLSTTLRWHRREYRLAIGNWMYKDATIFSKIKKSKFDEFVAHKESTEDRGLDCKYRKESLVQQGS